MRKRVLFCFIYVLNHRGDNPFVSPLCIRYVGRSALSMRELGNRTGGTRMLRTPPGGTVLCMWQRGAGGEASPLQRFRQVAPFGAVRLQELLLREKPVETVRALQGPVRVAQERKGSAICRRSIRPIVPDAQRWRRGNRVSTSL